MLEPGESWTAAFTITPHSAQPGATFALRRTRGALTQLRASKAAELEQWLAQVPATADRGPRARAHLPRQPRRPRRLRTHSDLANDATLPAAGLPWFMALFGRDSLLTSFQALPYLPGLAATTLRVLAER